MCKLIFLKRLATAVMVLLLGFGAHAVAYADSLYIGDGGDDTVKKFDANTGKYLGTLVTTRSNGLIGPMGILRKGNELLVVNQNVDQPFNGEILSYNKNNGAFNGALVPCQDDLGRTCDLDSLFTPRGMIRGPVSKLFVADMFGPSFDPNTQGSVRQYDINSGLFLGQLDTTGFTDRFHPRGLVIGPDGLLYVSIRGFVTNMEGYILRFNAVTGRFVDVFASNTGAGCAVHLHRPEGLAFGPDGKLYITSFRADGNDTDKILVYDRKTKQCVDQIDLYSVNTTPPQPRAFAQALVFGPNGKLFVPINNTGEVRRYDVRSKTYTIFVPKAADGGQLIIPWYLTFGETNPRTLGYGN